MSPIGTSDSSLVRKSFTFTAPRLHSSDPNMMRRPAPALSACLNTLKVEVALEWVDRVHSIIFYDWKGRWWEIYERESNHPCVDLECWSYLRMYVQTYSNHTFEWVMFTEVVWYEEKKIFPFFCLLFFCFVFFSRFFLKINNIFVV